MSLALVGYRTNREQAGFGRLSLTSCSLALFLDFLSLLPASGLARSVSSKQAVARFVRMVRGDVRHCLLEIGDGKSSARERIDGAVKKTDFLPRLESLRGIAALAVVGYHVSNQLSAGSENGWLDMVAHRLIVACTNGTGSVVTFFVLSGFVLARSLDRNSDPVRFFRHRLFRLFPAAIAVVTLLTALYWRFGFYVGFKASFDPTDVILNLLMMRSDINSVMWSMTVECVATPLILLSVWLFKQHGERWLWGLIVLLVSLSSWGPYVHLLGGFTNLAPLYAFVVGVLLHFRGARHVSTISPRLATFEGVAAIALFCFCGTRTQSALILLLECVSSATLIALIAWRPGMPLFKPLDFGIVRFYGRISYSFYLIHLLGISLAFRMIDPAAMNADGMPLSLTIALATVISILVTTPAAYLSWRFIETPAIAFGKARISSATSTVSAGRL